MMLSLQYINQPHEILTTLTKLDKKKLFEIIIFLVASCLSSAAE